MSRPTFDAESIFLAALERPDLRRRASFVASACGRDDALRRRVEALLRAHDDAGSFLGGPVAGTDLRACDPRTDAVHGQRPVANTLTILSLSHGTMPRVLLRDPVGAPETPIPGPIPADEAKWQSPSSRYHLFGEIARGGMGAILKGHDTELGRDLAIKVLLDDIAIAPSWSVDSSRRRRSAANCSIPGSCRSTSWASFPTAARSSP